MNKNEWKTYWCYDCGETISYPDGGSMLIWSTCPSCSVYIPVMFTPNKLDVLRYIEQMHYFNLNIVTKLTGTKITEENVHNITKIISDYIDKETK